MGDCLVYADQNLLLMLANDLNISLLKGRPAFQVLLSELLVGIRRGRQILVFGGVLKAVSAPQPELILKAKPVEAPAALQEAMEW